MTDTTETTPSPADDDALLAAAIYGDNEVEAQFNGLLASAEPTETPGDTPAPDAAPSDVSSDPTPTADAPGDTPASDADADSTLTTADPVDPFTTLLADAKPLTYKVNGTERPFDAILSTGDGKPAIIPAERVAEVRDMVARYEHNVANNKELYQTVQRYESLGGLDKFHELQERNAQLNAASLHILDSLAALGIPPETMALLTREAKIAAAEARFTTIEQRQTAEQTFATTTNDAAVKESAIPSAIDTHFASVPAEDREAAKAYFAQFRESLMFKATPEQALQFNVKPGTWMVDLPKMAPFFDNLAKARTAAASEAEKRMAAAKENAARTAATPAKPLPPRKPTGEFRRPSKQEAATMRKMTYQEVQRYARTGKDIPEDGLVPVDA